MENKNDPDIAVQVISEEDEVTNIETRLIDTCDPGVEVDGPEDHDQK